MTFAEEINGYIGRKRYRLINSVLFWQDSEILAENYYNGFTAHSRNVLRSVAKSIMSLAAGIALDRGLLPGLDTPAADYIPVLREGRDPLHPLITVRHLLTMTSGIYWNGGIHYHCPMMEQMRRSGNWLSHIADLRTFREPAAITRNLTLFCWPQYWKPSAAIFTALLSGNFMLRSASAAGDGTKARAASVTVSAAGRMPTNSLRP